MHYSYHELRPLLCKSLYMVTYRENSSRVSGQEDDVKQKVLFPPELITVKKNPLIYADAVKIKHCSMF